MTASTLQDLIKAVGMGMDFDRRHKVFGTPGTERISFLHKEPTTGEDTASAIYETLRASGVTLEASPLPAREVFRQAGLALGLDPQETFQSFSEKLGREVEGQITHRYDKRDVEIDKIMLARDIRMEAQHGKTSSMRGEN